MRTWWWWEVLTWPMRACPRGRRRPATMAHTSSSLSPRASRSRSGGGAGALYVTSRGGGRRVVATWSMYACVLQTLPKAASWDGCLALTAGTRSAHPRPVSTPAPAPLTTATSTITICICLPPIFVFLWHISIQPTLASWPSSLSNFIDRLSNKIRQLLMSFLLLSRLHVFFLLSSIKY